MIPTLTSVCALACLSLIAAIMWRDAMRAVSPPMDGPREREPWWTWLALFGEAAFLALLFTVLFILTFGYPSR